MSDAPTPARFTAAQQTAIDAAGNVLVVAGAGAGKTSVLVERSLKRVLNRETGLDKVLLVTFTEAAAAEMRLRIRERIESELEKKPADDWLQEQLLRLDSALICTLHAFCLRLIQPHFYQLQIDPRFSVMTQQQARLMQLEVVEKIIDASLDDPATQSLLLDQAGSRERLQRFLLKIHEFTQARPQPESWFQRQEEIFGVEGGRAWKEIFQSVLCQWSKAWLERLGDHEDPTGNTAFCSSELEKILRGEALASALQGIAERKKAKYWERKKTLYGKPIDKLFDEARFLGALCAREEGRPDPLEEDWNWARGPMLKLVELARVFTREYAGAKRLGGWVDFADLEQFALTLLWDERTDGPSPLARTQRERFHFVCVDEFQDINEAQARIIDLIAPEGERFFVGDVKQSIYGFRQAAPWIFQGQRAAWGAAPAAGAARPLPPCEGQGEDSSDGQTVSLNDNFRSHEDILHFVNGFFGATMTAKFGGADYEGGEQLLFGAPDKRPFFSAKSGGEPPVECHWLLLAPPNPLPSAALAKEANPAPPAGQAASEPETGEIEEEPSEDEADRTEPEDSADADYLEAEQEATLVARRFRELKDSGFLVWDKRQDVVRPIGWGDMVILARAATCTDAFARVFQDWRIPFQAKRAGFYLSAEARDLIEMLRLLDNPLQDISLLAALRSPFCGLRLEDLAAIRLALRKELLWKALNRFHETGRNHPAWGKVDRFLSNYHRWRRASRHLSIAQLIETLLAESSYRDWAATQARASQRLGNIEMLLERAREFDTLHYSGLNRFTQLLRKEEAAEVDYDPADLGELEAVRLMTIHKSKGLEFPVVALVRLNARFNFIDLHDSLLLDGEYGLCPMIAPPDLARQYPSLPLWRARQKQRAASAEEELRILYVAMTRAQQKLILTAAIPPSKSGKLKKWKELSANRRTPFQLEKEHSWMDWIGPWLPQILGPNCLEAREEIVRGPFCSVQKYEVYPGATTVNPNQEKGQDADASALRELKQRLEWVYPYQGLAGIPAKKSVSKLRLELAPAVEEEEHFRAFRARKNPKADRLAAAEVGLAHHRFLQFAAWSSFGSRAGLEAEARRLAKEGLLHPKEAGVLDLDALASFWASPLGAAILLQADCARRELSFTYRLTARDVKSLSISGVDLPGENEFVILQGAADLVLLKQDEIWIVDFKTNQFPAAELANKTAEYEPQLRLYAHALKQIYDKPAARAWLHFLALGQTRQVV